MRPAGFAPLATLAAALAATLAAPRAARADLTVASRAGDALYVHRVSADKLDKVFEERGKGLVAYAFTDARTLWALRKGSGGYTIGKIVDGKAEPPRAVSLQFGQAGTQLPAGMADEPPGLVVTKGGKVLVTTCIGVASVPGASYLMTCALGYTRVDDGSGAFTKVRPRDVVFEYGVTRRPKPAALKAAPKGYGVKIARIKLKSGETYTGYTCSGPGGVQRSWPTESDEVSEARMTAAVDKVTWLAAAPAVVHIEAHGVSAIGEKLFNEWYLLDCTTLLSSVGTLRDGLWMTDGTVRKPTGAEIGKLPGDTYVLAP